MFESTFGADLDTFKNCRSFSHGVLIVYTVKPPRLASALVYFAQIDLYLAFGLMVLHLNGKIKRQNKQARTRKHLQAHFIRNTKKNWVQVSAKNSA